jgi:ribosome modulation factor
MNDAYLAGRKARNAGQPRDACPYGHTTSLEDDTAQRKQSAQRVMRAYWLGGWHDAEIEMGISVLEVER